jgi:hypothetical protein
VLLVEQAGTSSQGGAVSADALLGALAEGALEDAAGAAPAAPRGASLASGAAKSPSPQPSAGTLAIDARPPSTRRRPSRTGSSTLNVELGIERGRPDRVSSSLTRPTLPMRNEVAQQDHLLERPRVSDQEAAAIELRRLSVDICIATRPRALF